MTRIATLITCHNRKAKTLDCLEALFANTLPEGYSLDVILVDDGSTDGTGQAVSERYPQVKIIRGDGSLFWNRGMHLAFATAMDEGYDYYAWLNDDTALFPTAIEAILQTRLPGWTEPVIVVGAICDPVTGEFAYGGARHIGGPFRPFLNAYVSPDGHPQEIDAMNGNVVFIPDSIARKVGNLAPVFEHAMGDTDYSMRARKLGVKILQTPGYIGQCSRNEINGTYRDKSLSLNEKIKHALSRKGLPLRSWLAMCRRHGGWLWPIHFIWGYTKIICVCLRKG
jgi:GT2 family glycosyltransferase